MSYEAADHYEDTGLTLTREEPDEGTLAYRDATRHLRAANERIRAAVERMRLNQEELERWWAERRRA